MPGFLIPLFFVLCRAAWGRRCGPNKVRRARVVNKSLREVNKTDLRDRNPRETSSLLSCNRLSFLDLACEVGNNVLEKINRKVIPVLKHKERVGMERRHITHANKLKFFWL